MNQTVVYSHELLSEFDVINELNSTALKIFDYVTKCFLKFFRSKKIYLGKIKFDEEMDGKATIYFCSSKYQVKILIDLADHLNAFLVFSYYEENNCSAEIGRIGFNRRGDISIPGTPTMVKKDLTDNDILKYFLSCIKKSVSAKQKTPD